MNIHTGKTIDRLKKLNLGCGDRINPNWVNVDCSSNVNGVIIHNLLQGIPFPDDYFDVVYHSHVLEHFTRIEGENFIKECYRVLKPNGIIRIAVPDLETIAKNYLTYLELSQSGDTIMIANYDWTMLEMFDQCVRNYGGGEMKKYLKQEKIINKKFVQDRIGYFFNVMTQKPTPATIPSWKRRIKSIIPISKIKGILTKINNLIFSTNYIKIGKFRTSGEVHQWMYDKFSLGRLLGKSGFKDIVQRSANQSYIINWTNYNLDTQPDGTIYKPDSLFMEARK